MFDVMLSYCVSTNRTKRIKQIEEEIQLLASCVVFTPHTKTFYIFLKSRKTTYLELKLDNRLGKLNKHKEKRRGEKRVT